MIRLDRKYVFHIPMCKYVNDELMPIDMDDILNDLVNRFAENGFESLYVTKIKSLYKSRIYDEKLITIYTKSSEAPEEIFKKWFTDNNDTLCQEALAYECDDEMYIIDLTE